MVALALSAIVRPKESLNVLRSKSSSSGRNLYVENYGCTANRFDFEIMLAYLMGAGYRLTENANLADIILINTCGVKRPTEDRILAKIRLFSRLNKPLIIAGCLPKISFKAVLKAAPDFSVMLDPHSVDRVLDAVECAEKGMKGMVFSSLKPILKLEQPKIRLNPSVEIIAISEGCSGECAFCCVRFARGALYSYPKDSITKRVSQAVSEGVKEIWLTSQDNGAYGLDIRTNLAKLLKECCKVEGKFLLRVGMMNPDHVMGMLPELIEAYKSEKIFKFLHLPVQSGDNATLMRMNRRYTVKEFKSMVHKFREEIPEITLSTDIICGFPSESREAFGKTFGLVEYVQPDIVNISKFFPRPNTLAMRMNQLEATEIMDRSRKLTELVKRISLNKNSRWLNWEGEILVDEKGRGSSWIGRNFAYKPIVIKSDGNLVGRFLNVRIIKAHSTFLEAEIVDDP
jgi:threonylcarbamoyladenosine tRNA methylthiotransferase CDKAL1